MRFVSKVAIILAMCAAALGQQKTNPATGINWPANCQVYNVAQAACPPVGILTFKGDWDSTVTYVLNDAVYYSGSTYVSLQSGNLDQNPATATAYWTILVSGTAAGGTTGAAQYNNNGALGGLNGNGYMFLNGASAPTITHPFSATPGGVYSTSADASRNMTGTDINTILGYTPATGPNFTSDFIACYLFLETPTGGGILPDHCGSNNGTVGTTAPVSDGVGWQFTNGTTSPVVLPAALNGAKTYYFVLSVPASKGGGWNAPQINTIMGSTVASQALFGASGPTGATQPYGGFEAFGSGGTTISTGNVFNGLAILTVVCNASGTDTTYFDGHLTTNSGGGTTCGHMSSGSFEFGGSVDGANFDSAMELYDVRVSNNRHTATQVAQNVAALTNEMVGRGVSFIPNNYQFPSQQLFFAGDSITCGYNTGGTPICAEGTPFSQGTTSSNAFTNHLTLDQTFGINNFGQPGAQVQQQVAAAPQIYSPFCGTSSGNSIAVLFEGTNNGGVNTPAQTWTYAAAWAQSMKAAGCKPVYIAMISRGGSFSGMGGGTYESFKIAYNAIARANWQQAGFAAFVDMEADPDLGCLDCYSNTTYFTGDEIHPTATGQLELAAAVSPTINYLSTGSTPANPNPTVITASTYTSVPEDGGRIFDTASNNIVDTLTSAQWMSGRIISVCNTSTSGSNTLTVDAPSDYPFNNVSGLTSVTVANKTCQQFQATFVSGTPNGDFWRLL